MLQQRNGKKTPCLDAQLYSLRSRSGEIFHLQIEHISSNIIKKTQVKHISSDVIKCDGTMLYRATLDRNLTSNTLIPTFVFQ